MSAQPDVKPPVQKPADNGGKELEPKPEPKPDPEFKTEMEDAVKNMIEKIPKDQRKKIEKRAEKMDLKAKYAFFSSVLDVMPPAEKAGEGTGPISIPGPGNNNIIHIDNPEMNKSGTADNRIKWPDDTWAIASDAARKRFVENLGKPLSKNTKNIN